MPIRSSYSVRFARYRLGVRGHGPKLEVWRMLDIFSQPCNIGVMQTQPYNIGKGKAKIMGGFACSDYAGFYETKLRSMLICNVRRAPFLL